MDRTEATGVSISVVGHVAVLAALTLGLATIGRMPPPSDAIEVSFVDEVGLVSAAPQPAQEPPAAAMAPEAGPPEEAPETTLPEPAPPQPAPPQPAPKQAAPTPARETPPARQRTEPTPRQAERTTRRSRLGDDILKGIGDDTASRSNRPAATMTGEARASINAAIQRALIPCERQPLPAPEASAIRVDVAVELSRNGSLVSAEVRRVHNDNSALTQYEQRMRDLALAVVRQCTPIRGLPPELYDVPRGWRQFTYQFPRQD